MRDQRGDARLLVHELASRRASGSFRSQIGTPVVVAIELRPDLPEPLNEICQACLSKAPAQRYQTAKDLQAALAHLRF